MAALPGATQQHEMLAAVAGEVHHGAATVAAVYVVCFGDQNQSLVRQVAAEKPL